MLPAVNALASFYFEGTGMVQNYEEALKLYRQAAEQGYSESQYKLG
ncbi:SEL1-like repeat protein, partial [Campylobacter jejuni]